MLECYKTEDNNLCVLAKFRSKSIQQRSAELLMECFFLSEVFLAATSSHCRLQTMKGLCFTTENQPGSRQS